MEKALDDDLVMGIVENTLTLPLAERDGYIAKICQGNLGLIEKVREYVKFEEIMDGFLLEPLCILPEPEFQAGTLLADRFRILRIVGKGGMGVVYKAIDERLGDKVVALKCARNGFNERLPPEVRHASEIAHPNVCKIFDIHTAATPGGAIEFITMEFLEGDTLADRLHGVPLRSREALDIARQICAGVAEAHRHGVVHGDLKTNNVILVRETGKEKVRAVITDFGLARGVHHVESAPSGAFESAPAGGTPYYMAPELFAGEKATPASDVYALGVILFELTAGRRAAGVSRESRLRRKSTAQYRKWDRIKTRCLDPIPARRFQSAAEVEEKLKIKDPPQPWVVAVAALLAAVVGVVTYMVVTSPKTSYTLAMFPVESSSADLAGLAYTVSVETAKQLANIKGDRDIGFKFIALDRVRGKAADSFAKDDAKPHATNLLRMSLDRDAGKITLHAVFLDASTGLPLPCVTLLCTANGRPNEWTLSYASGEERHAPVAVAGMATATLKLRPLELPAMNSAARADYEAGIQETRQNGTLASAISRLELAVKEDPDSPLVWGALAEARWFQFRYTSGRAAQIDQIKESLFIAESRNPDTAVAHRVEGYLFYNDGLYGRAEAEFSRAIALQPGNAVAHIWLAKALEDNNQPDAAGREFLKATEVEPGYFRTFQNLAAFYQDRSNYEDAARNLQNAVNLAPESEKAALRGFLGAECAELGEFRASKNEYQLSLAQHDSVGTRYKLGQTLMYDKDDLGAIIEFQQALHLLKSGYSPDGTSRPLILMYLGIAYRRSQQDAKAIDANLEGLKAAKEELEKNYLDGYVNAFLGYFNAALGKTELAKEEIEGAAGSFRDNADVRWRAVLTYEELYRKSHDPTFRNRTLRILRGASEQELSDLNRWPDLEGLRSDPQFKSLLISRTVRKGGNVCR
jgi:tetratricopeptide (TPR) repeat protein